jgi:hypothetical protein
MAGQQLLAGAGLAGDQQVHVRLGQAPQLLQHAPGGRVAGDEVAEAGDRPLGPAAGWGAGQAGRASDRKTFW